MDLLKLKQIEAIKLILNFVWPFANILDEYIIYMNEFAELLKFILVLRSTEIR